MEPVEIQDVFVFMLFTLVIAGVIGTIFYIVGAASRPESKEGCAECAAYLAKRREAKERIAEIEKAHGD